VVTLDPKRSFVLSSTFSSAENPGSPNLITMNGMQTTAARPRSRRFLHVHHYPIFPIDTVAVRPATRKRPGGTIASDNLGFRHAGNQGRVLLTVWGTLMSALGHKQTFGKVHLYEIRCEKCR
jgi:hypothetical protein